MESKPWYHSKAIWVSVASVIIAISTSLGFELDPVFVQTLLFGVLGLFGISLRLAVD